MKDVVPALTTNQDGLRKVLDDLVKQYKTKQEDLEKWKVSIWQEMVLLYSSANLMKQKKNNVQVVQQ